MKFFIGLYISTFFPFILFAQLQITLQSAVDTALKNNLDIQIARNYSEIDKLNNTYGMAGGLPSVNVTAVDNNSLNNINQKLNNGTEIIKDNTSASVLTAGITASITLFNGFKIIATKERLNFLQKQGELELNQEIQNVIAAVMVKYYDILRQQSYLHIMQSSLEVSQKKSDIIKERYNVGVANDADLMQAQIDENSAEQNFKTQELTILNSNIELLEIMNVKQLFPILINDTIVVDNNIKYDSIVNYLSNNPQYLSAEQQIKINEQIVKEISSQRYPSIKVNTSYNYYFNKSEAGFNLFNQNYGPSVGATLQIPIFNGNINKTQQEVAMYNVKNAELQKSQLLASLKVDASKTFQSYQNTLERLISQKENYELSKKLVELIIQKFQLNQATILDVKAAQASYESAGYLLVNLQYAAKIAEIELKRLIYGLGK